MIAELIEIRGKCGGATSGDHRRKTTSDTSVTKRTTSSLLAQSPVLMIVHHDHRRPSTAFQGPEAVAGDDDCAVVGWRR